LFGGALLVLLIVALFAAPAADAAFPGRPGPIVYSRFHPGPNLRADGIFVHGPRQGQRARRLINANPQGKLAYSPDGLSIALATNAGLMYDQAVSRISVVNVDGTGLRQVTEEAAYDSNPSFSPDGRRIVFDRVVGFGPDSIRSIFSVNIDGSDLRRLTFGPSSDFEPTFTPDGRRIVFVTDRNRGRRTDPTAIYSMRADGSDVRLLIDTPGADVGPDVSPSGRRIVFLSDRDGGQTISVAGSTGRDPHPLRGRVSSCDGRPCFYGPVWSPDGKRVAAVFGGAHIAALVVMRSDGSGPVKRFVTERLGKKGFGTRIGAPAWGRRRE
jgi:Tol biopolymer transport system component